MKRYGFFISSVLKEGLPIADLYRQHPSIPFNPLLANALYLAKYIERAGSGTDMMLSLCREYGLPRPEFRNDAGFFVITIRRLAGVSSAKSQSGLQSGLQSGEVLRKRGLGERILVSLADDEKSRSEIVAALGMKGRSSGLNRCITDWLASDKIKRTLPEKPNSRLQKYRLTEKGRELVRTLPDHCAE